MFDVDVRFTVSLRIIMRKHALTSILLLVGLLSSGFSQEKSPQEPRLLTFAYLQKGPPIEGPFRIRGYVIETYECPPCPPGAQCKPCIGNYVVITDNLKEKDPKFIRRLRIFSGKTKPLFTSNEMYLFTVKVRGKVQDGHAIEDADLIDYERYIVFY
jgi:hypothetical protein